MKVLSSLLCTLFIVLYYFTTLAADKVVIIPLGGSPTGITEEVDPTVATSVKDGVSWGEVTDIPAGFSDNTDNDSGGDITGVTAGLGLTGGGDSGNVVLNIGQGIGVLVDGNKISVNTVVIQSRVNQVCSPGSSIREIYENGTVACERDDDTDTTYSFANSLSQIGNTVSVNTSIIQRRVSDSCSPGNYMTGISAFGDVYCDAPAVMTIQEQDKTIIEQQDHIASLENRIARLEALLSIKN